MRTIVPDGTPSQVPAAPFDRTAALGRADGCPSCVHNVEPPRDVAPGSGCFYAGYHCHDCGHAWMTSWSGAA